MAETSNRLRHNLVSRNFRFTVSPDGTALEYDTPFHVRAEGRTVGVRGVER